MPNGINRRRRGEQDGDDENRPGKPGAKIHDSYDY
jgi:hypothetical protein